tara:strand:- start:4844 stop:5614 length:771 start_codon:yes stop_codon:yes gene_type:complete
MIKVVILGTGNVAKHLYEALMTAQKVKVVQIVGRNQEGLEYFERSGLGHLGFDNIKVADIYIIAVSDDAISKVSKWLTSQTGLVVHTAGSIPIGALAPNKQIGVLYPLQTFSKDRKVDFGNVPLCIETINDSDLKILRRLAQSISDKVYEMNSEKRKNLHLAAVFANNFTNHLYHIANEICDENQIPFEILGPLILETAQKVGGSTPFEMQTGPARRNDIKVINTQRELLKHEWQKSIYDQMSASILKTYGFKNKI